MKRGKSKESLGRAELELLQYVDAKQPVSVGDAASEFGTERGLARTTVQTMLQRLVEKGYLKRRQLKGVFAYSVNVPASKVVSNLVNDFVRSVLGGSISPLVAYLSQAKDLSADELTELKNVVRQMEQLDSAESTTIPTAKRQKDGT